MLHRRGLACVIAAMALGVLGGCGGDDGGGGGGGGGKGSGGLSSSDYKLDVTRCDPLLAEGKITNKTGSSTAFEITAQFEYDELSDGIPFQSAITESLGDGQTGDFTIHPDPAGPTPNSCEILSVKRAKASPTQTGTTTTAPGTATTAPTVPTTPSVPSTPTTPSTETTPPIPTVPTVPTEP